MKRLSSLPKEDGFIFPAEFEEHKIIWMIWPQRINNWKNNALNAQITFS